MKKILILLTAIFSLAVFIAGYGAELDRQSMLAESTAAELKSVDEKYDRKWYLLQQSSDDWSNKALPLLERISRDQQVVLILHQGVPNREKREETILYTALPEGLEYPAYTASGIPINQQTLKKYRFTTDYERAQSEDMILLDFTSRQANYSPERIVGIYPLEDFMPLDENSACNIEMIGKDLTKADRMLTENFSGDQFSRLEMGGGLTYTRELQPDFLKETILIFSVGLVVMVICWFFENKREVMIRKLLGQKAGVIFVQVFLPGFMAVLFSFLLIQLLFYLIFVGDFRAVNQRLLAYLLRMDFCFLAGLLICSLILLASIFSLNLLESMKESRSETRFSSTGFLVKTACITLSLSALATTLYVTWDGLYTFAGLSRADVRSHTTGTLAVNWVSPGNPGNAAQKAEAECLEKIGQEIPLLFQIIQPVTSSIPYVELDREAVLVQCNTEYLERFPVLDAEGRVLHLLPGLEYVLIPEQYQYKEINEPGTSAEIVTIQSGQSLYALSAWQFPDQYIVKDPVIYVTHRDNPLLLSSFVSGGSHYFLPDETHSLEEVETLLDNQNFQNISWLRTSDSYTTKTRIVQRDLMKRTGILLTLISIFAVLMFYTTRVFLIDDKYKAAIQTLLGRSWLDRYGVLFLLNGLVYLGCALMGIFCLQTDPVMTIWIMVICAGLDYLISAIMIYRFEKNKLAQCLKGDDL